MRKHANSETIVVQPLNWLHTKEVEHLFATSDIELHVNFSPGELSDWSPNDHPHYMGIFAGSTLIGVATIGVDDGNDNSKGTIGLLSDVYIVPGCRGKGYGSVLVKAILSIAQDLEYEQVNAEVLDTELLDWYSELGFQRTSDYTATFYYRK